MGIESDQLVYDYLSRVGDLAQQRQLPSGTRMRLVSTLRGEIDRQRAAAGADSPATVRRILGRLGTPDEVVAGAGGGGAPAVPRHTSTPDPDPGESSRTAAVPGQRVRRRIPRPRLFAPGERAEVPDTPPPPAARPPHLAGLDELGSSDGVDWWTLGPRQYGAGDGVAGFTGGVEIPEILRPPPKAEASNEPEASDGPDAET
ncbi:hypothetical protein ACWF94_06755, partial [Streptomyces sp. NPDC055078]